MCACFKHSVFATANVQTTKPLHKIIVIGQKSTLCIYIHRFVVAFILLSLLRFTAFLRISVFPFPDNCSQRNTRKRSNWAKIFAVCCIVWLDGKLDREISNKHERIYLNVWMYFYWNKCRFTEITFANEWHGKNQFNIIALLIFVKKCNLTFFITMN